jgi:drug/metabolite transporter (DMT)-like permease
VALLAVGFVLLWNSGFIGAEFGLPHSGPFTLLFWRYAALTLLLLLYTALRRRIIRLQLKELGRVALVGVLSHAVWLSCVLLALERDVPAGIVALVVALQPLLTGALSGWATGERTSLRQWIGLTVGFLGVVVAVVARLALESSPSVFGYLVPFLSAAAITAASLIQRRAERRPTHSEPDPASGPRVSLEFQLLIQCAATTAAVALPGLFLESFATNWVPEYLATMAWLIIMVSLSAYALMWVLISKTAATRVASLFYLGPPVTMVMAWIAFGDTLWPTDVVGLAVAALGVAIVSWRARRQNPSETA